MKTAARELRDIVSEYSQKISGISDIDFSARPAPHKWSRKEVLGHLIDSAQNNLRRFIVCQYETSPPVITYQQDFWVSANQYHDMDRNDLLRLWILMNQRICVVLEGMPPENREKECNTGSIHTLTWLAVDYVKHMKHHINQIIPGSFKIVYS